MHTLSTAERWQEIEKLLPQAQNIKERLLDPTSKEQDEQNTFHKNIENFIGTVKIPVGIAGPLHVRTSAGDKQYGIPMATTEAALVASVCRGCKVLNESGGASARVVDERVQRAPVFMFDTLENAISFRDWAMGKSSEFKEMAETTTTHGKLLDMFPLLEATAVHLIFEYFTGEASGQNMVTFATEKVYSYIEKAAPKGLIHCAIDGGHSCDKRASAMSLHNTRGRKVIAEATVPNSVLEKYLRTSAEKFVRQRMIVDTMEGTIGTTMGNMSNVLTSTYIACGQDPACVVESSMCKAKFELTKNGDLYCAITLPCILVGTVGGGTHLPSQSACLELVQCSSANELAEVIAAAVIAGELSITASLCADEFARAHFQLARAKL